jgi:hypothetical protein
MLPKATFPLIHRSLRPAYGQLSASLRLEIDIAEKALFFQVGVSYREAASG